MQVWVKAIHTLRTAMLRLKSLTDQGFYDHQSYDDALNQYHAAAFEALAAESECRALQEEYRAILRETGGRHHLDRSMASTTAADHGRGRF
jgi:hypothetical protein